MEIYHWILAHGFDLVGVIGIVGSLGFTTAAFRRDERSRHISNLLAITEGHREIWSELYGRPELARVLEPEVDFVRTPLTTQEALFVTFLLNHLDACFKAEQQGMYVTTGALQKDVAWFFALPIPKSVWEKSKAFQDEDFAQFVEENRK